MQYRTETPKLQSTGDWPATRDEGLRRLADFAGRAGAHYAAERNYDLGPDHRHNVSVLSPYIRLRLLTESEVVAEALASNSLSEAATFIQEVTWRTYWKGWLESRPGTWDRYVAEVAALEERASSDAELADRLNRAMTGATGIACFDAWARELVETGYLHNHARMWFSSIWIYTLKLPWQLGAEHFLRHLLDGDPASNTLSWRWMCGLHTAGKTYLARPHNIAEFTGGRFPPAVGLAEIAPPLSDDAPPDAPRPPRESSVAPRGSVALLVTSDDLSPETLPFGDARVEAVIIAQTDDKRASERVRKFRARALDDAAHRAEKHFWTRPARVDLAQACAAEQIIDAAGGRRLVVAEEPVGPVRTAMAGLAAELDARAIGVHRLRREWDAAFWPLATRGFFQMKSRIPETLRQLGFAV